jgi:hypothetical protein
MDDKIKSAIDKIVVLSKQNQEFATELIRALGYSDSTNLVSSDDERINQIYEYCIEKIIRKQAQEFYQDFPIKSIVPVLIEDYIRMEFFHRKDNFGDFCMSLYQQIENITNRLCEDRSLNEIAEKMWAYPAYVKTVFGKESVISDRSDSDFSIAQLIFPGTNREKNKPYAVIKSQNSLQAQYANDKIRSIVYFVGYKGAMQSSDYKAYIEITGLIFDIYQCRNMNHRGSTLTIWEQATQDKILPLKSFYYFKFMGVLAQFISYIKDGYSSIHLLAQYASTLQKKAETGFSGLKILGKIDVSNYKRKKKF